MATVDLFIIVTVMSCKYSVFPQDNFKVALAFITGTRKCMSVMLSHGNLCW